MLPMWTPFFLLCLMILACVWGMPLMLNRDALEGIFRHHEPVEEERATACPAELNSAVKAFISWPKEGAIKYKEAKPEQVFGQEGHQENKLEVPFNFQNLELKPVIGAKEDKVLEQNKESKVQGNGKERIRRAPYQEFQDNVRDRKPRLINAKLVDYSHQ